jgi:CRP-like cAMP-binding protein
MFIVGSGRAVVVIEPDRRQVATIERGGYFGEMSMLTGEPRTATVVASGDTVVFEIGVDLFRHLAATSPQAIEQVGAPQRRRRAR